MREKVKYERTLTLHKEIIEKFENANFEGLLRNRALKFLRILTKNSKNINDDSDSYNWVEFPNTYLQKAFGGRYIKIVDKLISANIIERDDHYSTVKHKCKKYRLIEPKITINYTIIEDRIDRNNIIQIGNKDNKYGTMYAFLHLPEYKDITYSEKLTPEAREATENFREATTFLKFRPSSIVGQVYDNSLSINISQFKVNEQIEDVALCNGDPSNKFNWKTTESLILMAKSQGKLLIQDNKKYFIMTEEEFINRKRKNVLESHLGIIGKINRGEFFASRNSTNNRLDTNFTSMPSYMFKSIMEDNGLIELDLCNSQMAIFTLICDLETEDYNLFKDLALNCNLYPYIQGKLGLSSVEEAKKVCFSVLFSHFRNPSPHLKKFKSLFPSVMEWINNYKKEHGSKNFSIILQKKEAEIFIDNVYQRVIDEKLLVFSKHDSIICRKSDEETVRKIMEDYFKEIDFQVIIR